MLECHRFDPCHVMYSEPYYACSGCHWVQAPCWSTCSPKKRAWVNFSVLIIFLLLVSLKRNKAMSGHHCVFDKLNKHQSNFKLWLHVDITMVWKNCPLNLDSLKKWIGEHRCISEKMKSLFKGCKLLLIIMKSMQKHISELSAVSLCCQLLSIEIQKTEWWKRIRIRIWISDKGYGSNDHHSVILGFVVYSWVKKTKK